MPKCIMLVGVPGSGKSTWLQNQEWVDDTYVASTDNIIESVADEYGLTYDEAFKDLVGFADKVMWRELEMTADDGDLIYVDRTNMSIKSRKRFFDLLKPFGYEFEAVVFPLPEKDEWNRRLRSRPGKTIPEHVLTSMISSFQMPTVDEGFSAVTIVENS